MKKTIISLLMTTLSVVCFSQENFKWDVRDSVILSKDKIYSETKLFIADYWKSAQNVIQSDDKESGIILIKGNCIINQNFSLLNHTYIFPYTVKFYMKDRKYRIVIDNVYCESAYCDDVKWPLLPVSYEYPGYFKTSLSKDRFIKIIDELKFNLDRIVSEYKNAIQNKNNTNDNW